MANLFNENYASVQEIDDVNFWKEYYEINELVFSENTIDHSQYRYPQYVKKIVCVDSVPEIASEFTNLIQLTIVREDNLYDLDDSEMFSQFPKLRHLSIVGFDVSYLNLNLPRLTHLILNECYGDNFSFHELNSLTHLTMENCSFTEKISGMSCLKNLVHLNMYGMDLDELPSGVYKLTQLERLDIGETKIRKLNHEFCRLVNLQFLNWSLFIEEEDDEGYAKAEGSPEFILRLTDAELPIFFADLIENSEHVSELVVVPERFVNRAGDENVLQIEREDDERLEDDEEEEEDLFVNEFEIEDSEDEDEDSGYEDEDEDDE
jgi:hypothetical protein